MYKLNSTEIEAVSGGFGTIPVALTTLFSILGALSAISGIASFGWSVFSKGIDLISSNNQQQKQTAS